MTVPPKGIRITPSAPAPNYALAYLAEDLGFFADNGLDVTSVIDSGPGSSWLTDNLLDGRADIALGGIWIPLAYRDRIAEVRPFALVCARNPQTLVARHPVEDFAWKDAYGKTVLLPMSSTSQWLYLEGALLASGYDPSRITFIRDLDESTIVRLWRHGLGDYFLAFPSLCDDLEDEGYSVATSLAEDFGDVPWSVYYATTDFITSRADVVAGVAGGLQQAMTWLHGHDSDDVARALHRRFPDLPLSRLIRSVKRLRQHAVFPRSVEIPEAPYLRYQEMIAAYGLVPKSRPFDEVVCNEFARGVWAGRPE